MRTLICDWYRDEPQTSILGNTWRLPASRFCELTNQLVMDWDDEFVAVLNGAAPKRVDWADLCADALEGQTVVASPLVSGAPWFERISPYAFVARVSTLALVKLDERLMFGWHNVLARKVDRLGASCIHVSGVSVEPSPEGVHHQGAMYYRQLQDQVLIDKECEGWSPCRV